MIKRKKKALLVLTAVSMWIGGNAEAGQNAGPNDEFRCVIGKPSLMSGELSSYKTVTIKPGDQHVEVEIGDDQEIIDRIIGAAQREANCAKEKKENKKEECLAELAQIRENAKTVYSSKLVLMMSRGHDYSRSLDGFTENDSATNSWAFRLNKDIPYNQGNDVHVVLGVRTRGPGLSAFERRFGFSFRDNSDLLVSTLIDADGTASDGSGGYRLTCTRLDGKFNDSTAQVSEEKQKTLPDAGSVAQPKDSEGAESQARTAQ